MSFFAAAAFAMQSSAEQTRSNRPVVYRLEAPADDAGPNACSQDIPTRSGFTTPRRAMAEHRAWLGDAPSASGKEALLHQRGRSRPRRRDGLFARSRIEIARRNIRLLVGGRPPALSL